MLPITAATIGVIKMMNLAPPKKLSISGNFLFPHLFIKKPVIPPQIKEMKILISYVKMPATDLNIGTITSASSAVLPSAINPSTFAVAAVMPFNSNKVLITQFTNIIKKMPAKAAHPLFSRLNPKAMPTVNQIGMLAIIKLPIFINSDAMIQKIDPCGKIKFTNGALMPIQKPHTTRQMIGIIIAPPKY